jgi:hypothetical protein
MPAGSLIRCRLEVERAVMTVLSGSSMSWRGFCIMCGYRVAYHYRGLVPVWRIHNGYIKKLFPFLRVFACAVGQHLLDTSQIDSRLSRISSSGNLIRLFPTALDASFVDPVTTEVSYCSYGGIPFFTDPFQASTRQREEPADAKCRSSLEISSTLRIPACSRC